MVKSITLKRHALVNTYTFNELANNRRDIITEKDKFSLSVMYFVSILDFDVSELAGKKIKSASVEMTSLNTMESLAVDVSTVSQQWDAAYCNNYYSDKENKWAGDGWFPEVIMSAGHSRYFRESVAYNESTKKVTINIDPYIVNAMAAGQSYGVALMDVKSRFYVEPNDVYINRMDFDAAENPPVLTVEYEDIPTPELCPVVGFSAMPLDLNEREGAAVLLNWEANYPEGVHYRMYISKTDCPKEKMDMLPKYVTPNPSSGVCSTIIENLCPETDYYFAIEATNGVVNSDLQRAKARTLSEEKIPLFPKWEASNYPSSDAVCKNNVFTVGVTDDINKFDPISGAIVSYGAAAPEMNSGIYDGKRVTLMNAKGEKQAFQLVVTLQAGQADFDVQIKGDLAQAFTISKLWYINHNGKWYPEVVVPVQNGKFSIPFAENKIPGQKAIQLFIESDIKQDVATGEYNLEIVLTSGGVSATVPVNVRVLSSIVPRSQFLMELNGYVYLPRCGDYAKDDPRNEAVERSYYQLGTEHGGTVNILPYYHSGDLQENFAPEIGMVNGEMRVTDWTAWDNHFAQYLDGSYMEEKTGKRMPVSHMYLPIHENWPMKMEDYYTTNEAPDLTYPDNVTWHHRNSKSVYEEFKPGYREGIKSVMKDFINHIEEKGWTDVSFQYFFNNKNFYKEKRDFRAMATNGTPECDLWLSEITTSPKGNSTSWWLLDEPHSRIDWEALAFYATILQEVKQETGKGEQIKFRADLSAFAQAFDYLDGMLDVNVVGGNFSEERLCVLRKRKRLFNEDFWPYGGWNQIDANNMNSTLWIIDTYLRGAAGIIPWYNYALYANYELFRDTAAIYPGKRFNMDFALPGMRLKSGRKAMELINYMDAFKKMFGYSDKQLRSYVSSFIAVEGVTDRKDHIDAGTAKYADTQNGLEALKRDMLRKMELAQPTPPPMK